MSSWTFTFRLERQPQRSLKLPGQPRLAGHSAESGAGDGSIRVAEIRMIENIVAFKPRLQPQAVANNESLHQRNVPVGLTVAAHSRQGLRKDPDIIRGLLRRGGHKAGGCVEPPVNGPLIAGQGDIVEIAQKNDIPEAQRRAALIREDAVDLPA